VAYIYYMSSGVEFIKICCMSLILMYIVIKVINLCSNYNYVCLVLISTFIVELYAVYFRASRNHWKQLPTQKKILYPSIILGVVGSILTVYYISHKQETPITKRKRFVCITGPQLEKIVQFEADMVLHELFFCLFCIYF